MSRDPQHPRASAHVAVYLDGDVLALRARELHSDRVGVVVLRDIYGRAPAQPCETALVPAIAEQARERIATPRQTEIPKGLVPDRTWRIRSRETAGSTR